MIDLRHEQKSSKVFIVVQEVRSFNLAVNQSMEPKVKPNDCVLLLEIL